MQGGPPILASRGKPGGFVFVGRPRKVLEPARGGGTATYAQCTGNTGAARTRWAQICTWTPEGAQLHCKQIHQQNPQDGREPVISASRIGMNLPRARSSNELSSRRPASSRSLEAVLVRINEDAELPDGALEKVQHDLVEQQGLSSCEIATAFRGMLCKACKTRNTARSSDISVLADTVSISLALHGVPEDQSDVVPLHNQAAVRALWKSAYQVPSLQPNVNEVEAYFGLSRITNYFKFIELYNSHLVTPAVIGVATVLLGRASNRRRPVTTACFRLCRTAFKVVNVVWPIVFLQKWKQYLDTLPSPESHTQTQNSVSACLRRLLCDCFKINFLSVTAAILLASLNLLGYTRAHDRHHRHKLHLQLA